jgi:hypothetical protein
VSRASLSCAVSLGEATDCFADPKGVCRGETVTWFSPAVLLRLRSISLTAVVDVLSPAIGSPDWE